MNDLTKYVCPPLHRILPKNNGQFSEKELTQFEMLVFNNINEHNTPYINGVDRDQKSSNACTLLRRRGWIDNLGSRSNPIWVTTRQGRQEYNRFS